MSPTPSRTFPSVIERYTISGSLNASMFYNFLMGVYTIVYFGTVHFYRSKKSSNVNYHVVLTTISVLYIFAFLSFILQWYFLDLSFVNDGDTRDSIFWASEDVPTWFRALVAFFQNFTFVVSDGLLIWRCYHVWGQSKRVVAIPALLLIAELAICITSTVLDALADLLTSASSVAPEHNIATALAFMSLGTTMSATFLIGYRIQTASGTVWKSKTRYNRIVATILESSAVYSLVLLLYALATVIPPFYTVESPLSEAQFYIAAMLSVISGMAPTVMVLRLAITSSAAETVPSNAIPQFSGLNFNKSQETGDANGSINIDTKRDNSSLNEDGEKPDGAPNSVAAALNMA